MGRGQSWGGGFGIGTESTYATYASPTVWVPIESETIKGTRPTTPASGIYTTRETQFQLPGIISAKGNFVFEADAHHMGLPTFYLNGQVSSAAFAVPASAPTGSASSGGTLTAGAYLYITTAVLTRTSDSNRFYGSPSPESAPITTASSNLTVSLTWTNPTIPSGFTQYGTAIWRTAIAGLTGTETFLKIVTGTGTTGTDDGSVARDTSVPVPTVTAYRHTYTPAAPVAGTHPLNSFSITKLMDQAGSTCETYFGARMASMSFSVGDPNQPPKVTYETMIRNYSTTSNPTPTYESIRPMMNWQGFCSIDGTLATYFEGADLSVSNNMTTVPALAGVQYDRDFYAGLRTIGGTLKFGYENKNNWTKMTNATVFALDISCDGTPTTAGVSNTLSSVVYTSIPYGVNFHMPKCNFQEGGGNLNKDSRMVESLPYKTAADPSTGYALKIEIINDTASYS